MPSWSDLIADNSGSRPELFAGIIAEDAPDESTMIEVIVKAFDQELRWGPCPWAPPRGDGLLPVEGDRCIIGLVTTEDPGQPDIWILNWWPT